MCPKKTEEEIANERADELADGKVTPVQIGVAGKYKVAMHPDCELPEGVSLNDVLGLIAEDLGVKKEDTGMN